MLARPLLVIFLSALFAADARAGPLSADGALGGLGADLLGDRAGGVMERITDATRAEFVSTGVASFDAVFAQAQALDAELERARAAIEQANAGIVAAAGMGEDARVGGALRSLRKAHAASLRVQMQGVVPVLVSDDPAAAVAVASLNVAATSLAGVANILKSVPARAKQVVLAAAALPKQVPDEAKAMGLDAKSAASLSGKVSKNYRATTKIPTTASALLAECTRTLGLIASLAA